MSDNVDENEAALLQAMMVDDTPPLPEDFKACSGKSLPQGQALAKMTDIIDAIKTVSDPEIMINVYDLGLIYKIDQADNGDLKIEMTLTAPACPVAGVLPQQVADAAAKVSGVGNTEVRVVWEPAWSLDRLSDDAKEMLEMF